MRVIKGVCPRKMPSSPLSPGRATNFASPLAFVDTLTAEQVADLKAGLYYVNIHSKKYPNGEIRGQLKTAE